MPFLFLEKATVHDCYYFYVKYLIEFPSEAAEDQFSFLKAFNYNFNLQLALEQCAVTAWAHIYLEFFQQIATELHDLLLVGSSDVETWIWRADYKGICRCSIAHGVDGHLTPPLFQSQTCLMHVRLFVSSTFS